MLAWKGDAMNAIVRVLKWLVLPLRHRPSLLPVAGLLIFSWLGSAGMIYGLVELTESVKGEQGEQGIRGTTGLQGDIGQQGPPGPTGLQGAEGSTGSTGSAGLTGATGTVDQATLNAINDAIAASGGIGLDAYGAANDVHELANEIYACQTAIMTAVSELDLYGYTNTDAMWAAC